jgi:DnaJ-class molecular chaperone
MAKRSRVREVKRALQNADDILFIVTGTRFKNVAKRFIDAYGEDLKRGATKLFTGMEDPELPPDNPYKILGIHPDALDIVVRGAYRALAKEYHPDTGTKPDPHKFQVVTEAYKAIQEERKGVKVK